MLHQFHFLAKHSSDEPITHTFKIYKHSKPYYGIIFDSGLYIIEIGCDAYEKLQVGDKIIAINGMYCKTPTHVKKFTHSRNKCVIVSINRDDLSV